MVSFPKSHPRQAQGFAGTSLLRWVWISHWLHIHHGAGKFRSHGSMQLSLPLWGRCPGNSVFLLFARFFVCGGDHMSSLPCFCWLLVGMKWWNGDHLVQVVGKGIVDFFDTDIFISHLNWWHCFLYWQYLENSMNCVWKETCDSNRGCA